MKATFRTKLFAIFGAALLALVSVLVVSTWMGVRQSRELDDVQDRLVPKTELGPRVEAEFERLARSMQDAVVAQDASALAAAQDRKAALFELIGGAGGALDPAAAASMRWAVQDYFQTAHAVSQRMIAGESSDALLQEVTRMQAQQARALALLKKSTSVDRNELGRAFLAVRDANLSADRLRLGITLGGIFVVALLASWGGGGMLQALGHLSNGLARFGTGDFRTPIPITTQDELAKVSEQANQMAVSLSRLSEARERDDWLKAGLSGLGERLRGELEPRAVAHAALEFLSERVGALAGGLYLLREDGKLAVEAQLAAAQPAEGEGATESFREGEGLLGRAFETGELLVVEPLPAGYLRLQSGLGETSPKALVLLPLVHFGRKVGILELALLEPVSAVARDLLLAARAPVVISLEAARASAARQALLRETQAQRLVLATQNEELERARSVLSQKADELNRVSAYKSQFLANMSHELRTPLNSMLLLSQLLAENESRNITPKQVEHLRTIHSAGQDLLSLINQVLDLSKIEAGKQDITLEAVEPGHFAAFARRLFEATAAQKGLELVTRVEPNAPALLVTDRQRVERILINLLSNALKFTTRGQVSLSIGRPKKTGSEAATERLVAFTVSDSGAGIPELARERVFAPFEQVQGQANRGHTGTGLGLPIARESARLLGGELVLESSSSEGSTFVCVVPERATTALATASLQTARVDDDAEQLLPEEPHLLIIEDDNVLAEQLVGIARARRLKVVVVGTGREGLRLAAHGNTIGIILDVRLPDLDGWSVMEQLKQNERTRAIPVHFVSGVDAPHRGLALGAVGYLVKPTSHAELATMMRRLVPSEAAQSILVVEDDLDQGASILKVLQQGGLAAKLVRSANAALEALRAEQFGCVILDLGLPDMDGRRVLETLRQTPELGSPRVVIHTGRALSKEEIRDLEAYAEAVVLKDAGSSARLLEEARAFVRHVTAPSLPAPAEPPPPDVSLNGIKLLLAEDDVRTVYSLSALLRGKGADVVTAENGQEALTALAAEQDIRGVLMDITMPEMDGYEAMRRLRQEPRYANLPVIALTAKAMKGERERCLAAGASDYLPKPIDAEKLLATLQRWLWPGGAP